jgi:hypothetical protein
MDWECSGAMPVQFGNDAYDRAQYENGRCNDGAE